MRQREDKEMKNINTNIWIKTIHRNNKCLFF